MSVAEARILIVDDQKSNVRLLEHTLQGAGYESVRSTMEPREVADLHREHRFQLILLDLQMPEMNGLQVLEVLKGVREENPVTILVISAEPSQRAAALAAGADDFLEKPFRLPDVVERVKAMLGAG